MRPERFVTTQCNNGRVALIELLMIGVKSGDQRLANKTPLSHLNRICRLSSELGERRLLIQKEFSCAKAAWGLLGGGLVLVRRLRNLLWQTSWIVSAVTAATFGSSLAAWLLTRSDLG